MRHPLQAELLNFAAGRLDGDEAERFFAHLAECPACTARYRVLASIRGGFDAAWDRFVVASPAAGETATPRHARLVQLARGVLDGGRRLATAAAARAGEWLEPPLLEGEFVPALAGVGDPAADAAARGLLTEASALCGKAAYFEALELLAGGTGSGVSGAREGRIRLRHAGRLAGDIFVDGGRRVVAIMVDPDALPAGTLARLELPGGLAPLHAPFQPVEGQARLLAEFMDVPDGPFLLQLELAQGNDPATPDAER